ncbi:MAG: RsmB/NOP family class I SAM-dependent RNA methyltransferase, partial [Alphaproteobacteria bacterium]
KNNAKIPELPGYNDGEWWVQDAAASLAVKALGKISDQRVLDLCAAPGGKTAQLIAAGAKTTALDISDKRLITLDENLNRLNFQTERTICADALEYLKNFDEEPYDIILLDAPCSATGTLRRHPETVHIKSSADIKKMAALQKQLLNLARKALKNNGILLYCTCSISKIEGENQIAEFLKDNHNFKLLPIKNIGFKEAETPEGYIRTLPFHLAEQGGMDAFFIAKLQKEA